MKAETKSNKRVIDETPHVCKICGEVVTSHAMGPHVQWKHKRTLTDYVKEFGEFRIKKLANITKREQSGIRCMECSKEMKNHQELVHHIQKHMKWEDYYIKYYFNGNYPLCKCGCGGRCKLLKSGIIVDNKRVYAREYLAGHNAFTSHTGSFRSEESRQRMSDAKIKALKDSGCFFEKTSKPEQDIKEFIESLGFEVRQSNRDLIRNREIDLYIPEKNIAIEYNGSRFHSDLIKKDKREHLKKTEELAKKGIRLFHIWEPDWIQREDILRSMISSILLKSPDRLYARKTEIRTISSSLANEFLKNNHLQGGLRAKYCLGLFNDKDLVSVMTFGISRWRKDDDCWELLRFANKLNMQVVGSASKLFKKFINDCNPKTVITYANRDWSIGNVYKNLGFEFIENTPPGYFYVKGKQKFNRMQFQKHKLVTEGADPDKTEYEIMTQRGYYRIWNCGNIVFKWNK